MKIENNDGQTWLPKPHCSSQIFSTALGMYPQGATTRACDKLSFRKINENCRKCTYPQDACDKRVRALFSSDKILNFYDFTRAL